MPTATPSAAKSNLPANRYDPAKVLDHPDYKVLSRDDPILTDKDANIACSYNAEREMHMLRKPMPEIEPDEVLLHVRATGICGSDVHFWKEGRIGNNVLCQECGAGHESAGEVIKVGSEVEQWKVGDRVAMEAGIPCGRADCQACLSGSYKSCPKMVFFSSPPYHGTMTRFHAHPAAWLHRLPDNVSYGEGALVEPLAVGLEAVEVANVRLGDPVLICGAGPIGLVTLLCADAAGCCPIVITDFVQSRLDLAKKLVPSVNTLQIQREWQPEKCAERIREAADAPLKTAFDCTGFEASVATAIHSLAFGGKVIVVGIGPAKQSYPFMTCAMNEIGIQFIFRYKHQYPKALRLIKHGKLNLKPLITHEIPLSQAPRAFDIAGDPSQGSVKVQVVDYE